MIFVLESSFPCFHFMKKILSLFYVTLVKPFVYLEEPLMLDDDASNTSIIEFKELLI